ncbi:MAG: hypothetical protein WAN50_04730 [Minisyncoccia bacterium]
MRFFNKPVGSNIFYVLMFLVLLLGTEAALLYRQNALNTLDAQKIPTPVQDLKTFGSLQDLGGGWSRYTNTALDMSFEYPSDEIRQNWGSNPADFNASFMQMDNFVNSASPGTDFKEIEISATSTDGLGTIDNWLAEQQAQILKRGLLLSDEFPNLRFETMNGVRVLIFSSLAPDDYITKTDKWDQPPETNLIYMHKNKEVFMSIGGFSQADTQRMVKSIAFLNRE